MEKPLTVRRVGRDLSFEVTSESDPSVTYVVTLNDPEFPRGHCTCDDFKFRIEPYVRRDEPPERPTCKHMDAVILSHYADYPAPRFGGMRLERFRAANRC